MVKELKFVSYIDRLKYSNLPTLTYRRFRDDTIMVYKLLSGLYDSNFACHLFKPPKFVTRGYHLRLFKKHIFYDLRKFCFGNRIISIWNSLPDSIVNANPIAIFERKLDNFWRNQFCLFDY